MKQPKFELKDIVWSPEEKFTEYQQDCVCNLGILIGKGGKRINCPFCDGDGVVNKRNRYKIPQSHYVARITYEAVVAEDLSIYEEVSYSLAEMTKGKNFEYDYTGYHSVRPEFELFKTEQECLDYIKKGKDE